MIDHGNYLVYHSGDIPKLHLWKKFPEDFLESL